MKSVYINIKVYAYRVFSKCIAYRREDANSNKKVKSSINNNALNTFQRRDVKDRFEAKMIFVKYQVLLSSKKIYSLNKPLYYFDRYTDIH